MAADIFASLSDEELQALLEDRDSSNTNNIIGPSKRILLVDHIDVDEMVAKSKEESWCFFYQLLRRDSGDFFCLLGLM